MNPERAAIRRYQKRWKADRARGVARGYIDADLIRSHLAPLVAEGWTQPVLGRAAGVSQHTIGDIIRGVTTGTQQATGRAILDVTRARLYAAAGTHDHVPAVGYLRRVRALHAIGWPRTELRARGVNVNLARNVVISRRHWQDVADVYDELWDKPGPSRRGADRARAWGWPPPLAWDDDTIDDPTAHPHPWAVTRHASREPGAFVEDAEWLAAAGESLQGAARRLGMTRDSLVDMLRQRGRTDLTERFKLADEREAS